MSKDDLVAVMLPREVAERYVAAWAGTGANIPLADACKRALRPDPPSSFVIEDLRDGGLLDMIEVRRLADWIEHVLEHGWEPES